MTSSLVGSEMCIRDSSRSATMRPLMLQFGPKQRQCRLLRALVHAATPHCLLYTSDAADDM
eukprot:10654732-Prorocentrum_lima.AAC.1